MSDNPIIDRFYNNSVTPSISGPGVSINLNINFPFTKLLDGLVESVKTGKMTPDQYFAMLDQYEVIIGKYRDAKL